MTLSKFLCFRFMNAISIVRGLHFHRWECISRLNNNSMKMSCSMTDNAWILIIMWLIIDKIISCTRHIYYAVIQLIRFIHQEEIFWRWFQTPTLIKSKDLEKFFNQWKFLSYTIKCIDSWLPSSRTSKMREGRSANSGNPKHNTRKYQFLRTFCCILSRFDR